MLVCFTVCDYLGCPSPSSTFKYIDGKDPNPWAQCEDCEDTCDDKSTRPMA